MNYSANGANVLFPEGPENSNRKKPMPATNPIRKNQAGKAASISCGTGHLAPAISGKTFRSIGRDASTCKPRCKSFSYTEPQCVSAKMSEAGL